MTVVTKLVSRLKKCGLFSVQNYAQEGKIVEQFQILLYYRKYCLGPSLQKEVTVVWNVTRSPQKVKPNSVRFEMKQVRFDFPSQKEH